MMQSSVRLLVVATLTFFLPNDVSGFGVVPTADSLHIMQSAATHISHTLPQHVDLLAAYKQTLMSHPLPTKMITGATLAVCGDAIAQSRDKEAEYDTRRASSFAVFDMAYRALQHYSFPIIVAACHGQYLGSLDVNHMFEASQWAAMERTLASQLGIVPFLYYPAFFALTGAVQGLTVSGAVARAQENFIPLMKRNLLFWIPVQFVQFGYIQEDLQIPFLSVCGLAWTFILSAAAGSTKNYTPQKEMEDATVLNLQQQQQGEDVVDLSSSDEDMVLPGRTANATSR
jgi:hypothetical protein